MASPNLDEITTTTLRNRKKEFADNVSKSNALLSRLSAKGNIDLLDGGRTIVKELEYAENATLTSYPGKDNLRANDDLRLSRRLLRCGWLDSHIAFA